MSIRIWAIRTVEVAKFRHDVRCPFQVGAFMCEYDSEFGGLGLQTVTDIRDVTFYESKEMALSMIKRCKDYAAKFEAVSFVLEDQK